MYTSACLLICPHGRVRLYPFVSVCRLRGSLCVSMYYYVSASLLSFRVGLCLSVQKGMQAVFAFWIVARCHGSVFLVGWVCVLCDVFGIP